MLINYAVSSGKLSPLSSGRCSSYPQTYEQARKLSRLTGRGTQSWSLGAEERNFPYNPFLREGAGLNATVRLALM
jgi:hypothetical protein